jgi:hypothetical protein
MMAMRDRLGVRAKKEVTLPGHISAANDSSIGRSRAVKTLTELPNFPN